MNNEQWGNIELPGLSDEKLLKTNWNLSAGSKIGASKQWANPIDRAKKMKGILEANNNPQVIENKKNASIEKYKDPNYYAKHIKSNLLANAKPVQDLESNILHESLAAAARYYNVAIGTMQYWIKKSKKDKFYYVI
jgi:hypothetical protein